MPVRTRPSIGSADLPAPTCTRSSFSSRGTTRNMTAASQSTKSLSPAAPASKCCLCSTFTPFRRLATRTSISAIATGCQSRPSRGTASTPTPGTGEPLKPGEFILGYPDEYGVIADNPRPEILASNGSYMAYRRLEEHVGKFRDFLRQHGDTVEEQELIAAKLMGRWRSGAPLVLAPEQDDPTLSADMQRNNDFTYKETDPHGYAVPLGSHIRRMNPRDTGHNMNRRRMIRRGAPYGSPLPEGAPDDGVERGIAAFVICASLIRQFEFAQNVWINDRNFNELGNERDPIIGAHDGTLEFKIPKRPIRKKIVGLPAFTTVRGGAYFFLPGLKALGYLASLNEPGRA